MFGMSSKRSHRADAVVTGAGSGIGAAFAVELARRGGRVVCSDIDEATAQLTVDAITDQGGHAVAVRCDVSKIGEVRDLATQSQSWFGNAPTLVINNAGVGAGGSDVGDFSLDDWSWTLGVNCGGRSTDVTSSHRSCARQATRNNLEASSTSPRRPPSARHPAWPHTTSARQAC